MRDRRAVRVAVVLAVLALGACAVPGARSSGKAKLGAEGMALTAADVEGPANPAVANRVAVGAFDGGELAKAWPDEAAAFQAAVPESLRVAGMLAPAPGAPLSVETRLLEAGHTGDWDVTVTLKLRYTVRETRSGGVVIDEVVTTSHVAGASDSLAGTIRRRLATDGAARKNLAALVRRLNTIQRKAPAAAPAQ